MTMGVKGEEYEAEEIATGFALATTSSDCHAPRSFDCAEDGSQ